MKRIYVYTFLFHQDHGEDDLRDVGVHNIISTNEHLAIEKLLDQVEHDIIRNIDQYPDRKFTDPEVQKAYDRVREAWESFTDAQYDELIDSYNVVGGLLDKFYRTHRQDLITWMSEGQDGIHFDIHETLVPTNSIPIP